MTSKENEMVDEKGHSVVENFDKITMKEKSSDSELKSIPDSGATSLDNKGTLYKSPDEFQNTSNVGAADDSEDVCDKKLDSRPTVTTDVTLKTQKGSVYSEKPDILTEMESNTPEKMEERVNSDKTSSENIRVSLGATGDIPETENNETVSKADETMCNSDDGGEKESSSGSEDEYESAEEGEEIQVDTQNLRDLEETLTDEQKEEHRAEAAGLKETGNEMFRNGSYKTAIKTYSRALRVCPLKFVKDRAIMYSNRGACKMRLEEYEDCIRDCTKALELHPCYLKALMRRAEIYEKTEKLDEALVDFQKILEMDPSQNSARMACLRLPDQIKERNEKMKEEMMSKLKDLGNMVLKPFGLSTNNFKLNQDPNTGGYSVNFVQNQEQ